MLELRPLVGSDIANTAAAFSALGWNKPASQYERYLGEAARRLRTTIVALLENEFTGYVTIKRESAYQPFRDDSIPEIQDLNVLPKFRRIRIGSRLMDEAEKLIGAHSPIAGLSVAFDPGYRVAQRLYVLRGYVPDARGGTWRGVPVTWGDKVTVDDDLAVHMTKNLHVAAY
ncbi:MAG TPA: GNAT family N-acetyltransferase [Rhizomicrobium sp.]|jgi:GNAT superfamily N-acetyltransferase